MQGAELGKGSMSEFQYDGFLAIHRDVARKQMEELRCCSTRARISATGFVYECRLAGCETPGCTLDFIPHVSNR